MADLDENKVTDIVDEYTEFETHDEPKYRMAVDSSFFATILTVDGVPIKNPESYEFNYADLDSDNAHTGEDGILNRDMIRSNHVTISLNWVNLRSGDMTKILQSISGDEKSSFQLKYFDYRTMSYKTGKFYSSDRRVGGRLLSRGGIFNIDTSFIEF